MSEKIYAAMTDDFIRRMRNWAKAGAGLLSANVRISSIYRMGVRVDRYVSTAPPVMMGEADDTDTALLAVPIRYRQAVMQFWRYETAPLRWHARKLRPGSIDGKQFSYHTFEAWVMTGHELLLSELAARSACYHARAIANANAVAAAANTA